VEECCYDPWSFERSAQLLADEGLQMVEFPQNNERMVPASQLLYEAVQTRKVVHAGDPEFGSHINAGTAKETPRGWRVDKNPKVRQPVDALDALVMAYSRAAQYQGKVGIEWF
jgi:phage terminase large subunit-like protein